MATVSPTPLDPWINRVLGGRYCLVAAIGRGGMGVVYRAWDRLENRYAVVKMPRAELLSQSQFRERFARELDVVRSLWHAAIVPVVDIGEEPLEGTASGFGMPYAVMPYLAGGSLSRRQPTRDGKPVADSPQSLWRWVPQIAEALDYVHGEQLVHRDVKPDNILFDGLGDPHLGDFGIAKVVLQADAETRGLTKTGMSIGTPEYMAPELIGGATPDGRADQYALAVTVFEILAGRKPFLATSPAAVLVQQATVPAPRLDSMRRDLPQSAVDALERALAKKPEARFSSCEGFAHALLAEIEQPGEAKKLRLMCPDCGELLKVQPSWAGQTGKCPHCTKKLAVSADLRSLWLEADRSEARVPSPVKRQSAIRRAVSWIDGHGVAVAVVLGVLALIPALLIEFGLTGRPNNTAVTQDDLGVEALRNQLAVATASEQTARKALEESQAEVARMRADLEQAATDLADEMQAGQEREAVLRQDLAALQQPADPGPENVANSKVAQDTALAATEPGRVALPLTPPKAVAPFDAVQARKHQEEWAQHLGLEVEITNSIGQKFIVIPPGSSKLGEGDETRKVFLSQSLYMGVHEVTNAQWRAVMGSVPSKWTEDDRPVEQVTWDEVVAFCRQLSVLPDEQQAGRVYRPPMESEWEYACRAGSISGYSFGDDESQLSEHAWFGGNSGRRTHPVGQKKPNQWGLFDMHGNVWEWCYGTGSAPNFVVRGGGWGENISYQRSAASIASDPSRSGNARGFRVVLLKRLDPRWSSVFLGPVTPQTVSPPPAAIAPFEAVQARKHQEEWAKHLGIEVEIGNSIGQTFVVIPPGQFTMGEGDKTVEVTLTKPFLLGQTEVTNAQWKAVMGDVPSQWKHPDRPVNNVTWDSAVEFCQKLSALPEEREAGRVYRLPTEAEWEFACRAGADTAYSFGNDESQLGEYAWFEGNSRTQAQPVGMKKPNPWGLFDMHGNVWEWCSDWYGEYAKGAVTDPQGPSGVSDRVVRGGAWHSPAGYCRSTPRHWNAPSGRLTALGFRIALTLPGLESKEAFATAASAAPSSPPEAGAPQVPPLPEGTPEQLLEFVEGLQRPATRPRSREELLEYMRDVGRVSVEAAERILVDKPQGEIAVRAAKLKLESLMMLGRLGDEQSTAAMKAFATTLVKGSSPELAREAVQMLLKLDAAISPFDAAQARKYQETWANHLDIEVETTNSIGQKFVVIPPGTFTMGEGDKTVEVTLTKPFLLGQTEVTNAQWNEVMGSVPSKKKDRALPVTNVTWDDAGEFCRQLSALPEEREAGRLYRLPTEAEWEFACRAGTDTAYSFGNDQSQLGEYAWFRGNARLQTQPVGKKNPSAWGLFDMHGNVRELCNDWMGEYPKGAVTDPQGPSGASVRVSRGGGWFSDVGGCRSANRHSYDALGLNRNGGELGFRLALSPSGAPLVPPEAAEGK